MIVLLPCTERRMICALLTLLATRKQLREYNRSQLTAGPSHLTQVKPKNRFPVHPLSLGRIHPKIYADTTNRMFFGMGFRAQQRTALQSGSNRCGMLPDAVD
jgi:hypothetical protein